MNRVFLSGRQVKDIDMTTVERKDGSRIALGRGSIAVRRDGQTTDFFDYVCFGEVALNIAKYAPKGTLLFLDCALQTSTYANKEGKTIKKLELIVNRHEFYNTAPKEQKQEIPYDKNGIPDYKKMYQQYERTIPVEQPDPKRPDIVKTPDGKEVVMPWD